MIQLEIKRRELHSGNRGTYDVWLYLPPKDGAKNGEGHHVVVNFFDRSLGAAALLREAVELLALKL